jgi:alpha,alpha-trehalase
MASREPHPPLRPTGGYLPIGDHGLIGDGRTCALVARDGSIAWLCVPRFDGPAVFAGILDHRLGGALRTAPAGLRGGRQRYRGTTGVLETELDGPDGRVRLTDALALRPGADLRVDQRAAAGLLVRRAEVLEGSVDLEVGVDPRGGARLEPTGGGCQRLRVSVHGGGEVVLYLRTSPPLDGGARETVHLERGECFDLCLSWEDEPDRDLDVNGVLEATTRAWDRWSDAIDYDGVAAASVRRSAVTLKLLDHIENGAIVAAATSSLPEAIGGGRNWDYRFAWIRDAAFSVYALRRIGLGGEARGFLGWVLDSLGRAGRAGVLYDIDGHVPTGEREDPELEGHRRSAPVRWGNAAADQTQNDAYGEIVDCAFQWVAAGGELGGGTWERIRALVDAAAKVWREPDHGIWEVRSSERTFTYSAAMCQVALDRGARIAERLGLPGDAPRWRAEADRIVEALLGEAWDADRNALREQLGGGALDASILSLPLRRVVPARHPKMVPTVDAVVAELGAGDGLLYRYLPDRSPDGLEGEEGAFLLCSFWLVDNLTLQGRLDEAGELFESLCARGGDLGLLPEQIDPPTGAFLGNHPQAFSHVGVIASALNLDRHLRGEEGLA